MELEARPLQAHSRDWHDRSQPAAGPSTSAPPSSFAVSLPTLAQRRRSSAAHAPPAGPPPNLPIPSVPATLLHDSDSFADPSEVSNYPSTYNNGPGRGLHSNSLMRPGASPNLAAVAAFSQSRQYQGPSLSSTSSIEDLSDPPPQSFLYSSQSRVQNQQRDLAPERLTLAPPELRPEPRMPSSRRALTRALELAREAVQLDSMNDNPEAAVKAYGRSVALLSEVMERVRRGEESTESNRRRRRRSVAAQEEEVRRLQNIHDTYADRMNILSIIYSIPAVPYSTSAVYSSMSVSTDSTQSVSPTNSASSSETSEQVSHPSYTIDQTHNNPQFFSDEHLGHDRDPDEDDNTGRSSISSSIHPYAAPHQASHQPATTFSTNSSPSRASTTIRRPRALSSDLPSPLPYSSNPLPSAQAPGTVESPSDSSSSQTTRRLDIPHRPRGELTAHRRSGSDRLAPLEEEFEKYDDGRIEHKQKHESDRTDAMQLIPDTPRTVKRDSHPLPPIPSPSATSSSSPGTPRIALPAPKISSPRIPPIIVPKPRGSSHLTTLSEAANRPPFINPTTNEGTIVLRRRTKTSAPPSTRSASPADSTASVGSISAPKSVASSLPGSTTTALGPGRSRSSSQPGRRPSLVGGRVSPMEQRPPLPVSAGVNGPISLRKASFPTKVKANPQLSQLSVQTDLLPPISTSLIPPLSTLSGNLPTTPTSPLPPAPPTDPLRKPYHMMNLLRNTMDSPTGGYVTRRLHVPKEVWSQGGAKLANVLEKVRVVGILCSALEELQVSSSEYFGAGNVSSGMALGIGSIGRKEGNAWLAKLEDFSSVCDGVVANFGKKLGVGEGFVLKKTTWGDKLTRRFDKFTNGKNLDSPDAYVQGLKKLFLHAQLLDEHTRAVLSQPVAPAYAALPLDIRSSSEVKLKRCSEFFASVVLTFVIRDLSQLLDKYAKKCEKWLAE